MNEEQFLAEMYSASKQREKDRRESLNKLFTGYEILFHAASNAALAGNVTCKLAIINLSNLYGNRRTNTTDPNLQSRSSSGGTKDNG